MLSSSQPRIMCSIWVLYAIACSIFLPLETDGLRLMPLRMASSAPKSDRNELSKPKREYRTLRGMPCTGWFDVQLEIKEVNTTSSCLVALVQILFNTAQYFLPPWYVIDSKRHQNLDHAPRNCWAQFMSLSTRLQSLYRKNCAYVWRCLSNFINARCRGPPLKQK